MIRSRVRLRLLGLPQVTLDERIVNVGSRKALALLAVLVLDGASARARLAALFWPDQDDAGARRNLRREVFRLRNAGVPIDDGDAQSLALAAGSALECDVLDPAGARTTGILLDGFDRVADDEFSDWLSNWRVRLTQRGRVDAVQAAALHEQHGELRAALDLHLAQLDADPTNESAAQHALRLHGRLGERDAALALFARLESQLHHQLGLAPLPATREIVQQLRTGGVHDAAPESGALLARSGTSSAIRRAPLPIRAPFAGRANERQRVSAAWQAGLTVFISGPPGVGKSRFAAECAGAHGAALFVNCRPDDIHLPYSSAVRALRALLDAAPDVELSSWARPELARLLPELGPSASDGNDTPEAGGDEARLRLFEAYAHAWLRLAEHNFNVIVLDDWQFADAASLQLWSFVDARGAAADGARSLADVAHAVRRLVAFRSGELAPESLAHMHRQLDAGRATLLPLDGLPQADVQVLVQQLAGQSGATLFAQRLHDATEGNPLFVLETIRHLFELDLLAVDPAGGWRTPFDSITSDYTELPVPLTARATMLARVRALGEGATRLLEAASLAGDAFDLPQLSGTAALDDDDSVAALERAQAAQVLRTGPDGQYRFTHDLFRQCVADSLSPARRALVHARLARNLAAAGGVPARIADHFEKAHLDHDAAPWFVQAGAAAAQVFDYDTAFAHYERALRLGLEARAAYDVHDRRLTLLHRQFRTDEQLRELTLMAEVAKSLDDSTAPFELANKRALTLINSGRVGDALAHARWVVDGAPGLALKVRARYIVGCGLMFLGDHEAAAEQLCAALADAPTALPENEPMICAFLCHIAISAGALDVAQDHYERGLRAANVLGGPFTRAAADMQNAGYRIAEARGQRPEAIRLLEDGNAFSIRTGNVNARINHLFNLITVLVNGGDVDSARIRRTELMGLLYEKSVPKARFFEHFTAGRLAAGEGNLALAWQSLRAAIEAADAAGDTSMQRAARLALAHLAADCGHTAALHEQIEKLATLGPHRDGELVLIEEALQAQLEMETGHVSAARSRMERACGVDRVQAHSSDPDWQENTEFACVVLAAARLRDGDAAASREALAAVRFSPRLMAMAAVVALDTAIAVPATDQAAIDEAVSLLAAGTVAPLEAARLWHALSVMHTQRGEVRAARNAASECQRVTDALAASIPDSPSQMVLLRESLMGRFQSWQRIPA